MNPPKQARAHAGSFACRCTAANTAEDLDFKARSESIFDGVILCVNESDATLCPPRSMAAVLKGWCIMWRASCSELLLLVASTNSFCNLSWRSRLKILEDLLLLKMRGNVLLLHSRNLEVSY
jgi:hypothetical protein